MYAILQIGDSPSPSRGSAACAVQLGSGQSAIKLLLSAHHVFSDTPDVTTGAPQAGWPIRPLASPQTSPFAKSSRWGGAMRADGQPSFDVQFAQVSDWDVARKVVSALRLSSDEPYAGSVGQVMALAMNGAFQVLTPPDNPRWQEATRAAANVKFELVLPDSYGFDYTVRENDQLVERHLTFQRLIRLKIETDGSLLKGDSGSAVVAIRADGSHTLIGLFIASGDEFGYAVPAWQLFDTDYYARLPGDGPLLPVTA